MKRYTRTDGDYLGTCRCGCCQDIYETVYRNIATGRISRRVECRFLPGHNLRGVHHYQTPGQSDISRAMAARRALILPLGPELHATIQQRRTELGLSVQEMADLLGWFPGNLYRYAHRPNVMRSTLERVLDRLYADEGGWVEAGALWTLVRSRQALWGMSDAEMAAVVGVKESRWLGKATARRVLLSLSSPRRACEFEKGRAA